MATKFPIKSQTSFDVEQLLITDQSETGPGSFPGEVATVVTEIDVAERDLENQDVVVNITVTDADFSSGNETYQVVIEGSDDNFVTIKQKCSILWDNSANTDTLVGKLHNILVRFQSIKIRALILTAGTTPAITVKAVWLSPLQT